MTENTDLIALTVDIVSAFVGQNNIRPDDVPGFIAATHGALAKLDQPEPAAAEASEQAEYEPAVSVRKSLASKDHIISMIDGKPYKTLRRHLSTHGLTPEDYRARYKLPTSYPMVSENYSAARREMARSIGLGRKPGTKVAASEPADAPKAERKPRKPRAAKADAPAS
jgi:predicted transcriptional regulator